MITANSFEPETYSFETSYKIKTTRMLFPNVFRFNVDNNIFYAKYWGVNKDFEHEYIKLKPKWVYSIIFFMQNIRLWQT